MIFKLLLCLWSFTVSEERVDELTGSSMQDVGRFVESLIKIKPPGGDATAAFPPRDAPAAFPALDAVAARTLTTTTTTTAPVAFPAVAARTMTTSTTTTPTDLSTSGESTVTTGSDSTKVDLGVSSTMGHVANAMMTSPQLSTTPGLVTTPVSSPDSSPTLGNGAPEDTLLLPIGVNIKLGRVNVGLNGGDVRNSVLVEAVAASTMMTTTTPPELSTAGESTVTTTLVSSTMGNVANAMITIPKMVTTAPGSRPETENLAGINLDVVGDVKVGINLGGISSGIKVGNQVIGVTDIVGSSYTDDELSQAASQVAQGWSLVEKEDIEAVMEGEKRGAQGVAMTASAIAEIINRQEFIPNLQSMYVKTPTTTTTTSSSTTTTTVAGKQSEGGVLFGNSYKPISSRSIYSSHWPAAITSPRLNPQYLLGGTDSALFRSVQQAVPTYQRLRGYYGVQNPLGNLYPARGYPYSRRLADEKAVAWELFIEKSLESGGQPDRQNELVDDLKEKMVSLGNRHGVILSRALGELSSKVELGADYLTSRFRSETPLTSHLVQSTRLYLATITPESQKRLMEALVKLSEDREVEGMDGYEGVEGEDSSMAFSREVLERLVQALK